jgi:predicted transcriptional regulator
MSITETTIRVPGTLRDKVKAMAAHQGMTQAELIDRALRELEQAEFLRSVAATEWDAHADAETSAWDSSDLAGGMDPWQPRA